MDACEYVIAVGEGSLDTAIFLGERYPTVECLACEPRSEKYFEATQRSSGLKNVYLFNSAPNFFLKMIERDKPYLFGRDVLIVESASGGGAERNIKREIEFMAGRFQAAFVLVTDVGAPDAGVDYSLKSLAQSFAGAKYSPYRPAHAAKDEWRLFALGRNHDFDFSDEAKDLLARG
jgi:hypothetical protein